MTTPDIEQLWAFISDDDGEGIAAFLSNDGIWMPLIAADKARVDSLRKMAQQLATESGVPVKLVKFSVREDLEVLEP
jgi:hypothetical protein